MSKIKQKFLAFKTAEKLYNKRKVALRDEIRSEMHKSARAGNIKRLDVLGNEMCKILGDENSFITIQIKVLYNIPL